jgi:hypothetical protein
MRAGANPVRDAEYRRARDSGFRGHAQNGERLQVFEFTLVRTRRLPGCTQAGRDGERTGHIPDR